jgi:catechol 2,3-dioxygenase-like lactoylglutathione lyase family enzyme
MRDSGTTASLFSGHTLQLRVSDIEAGTAFYAALFGRDPDVSVHEDFHEREIGPECPRMRAVFGIECGDIERFPGFVAWCNFTDPWGNRLGFSQDLVDGERMLPGGLEQGSVR